MPTKSNQEWGVVSMTVTKECRKLSNTMNTCVP